MNRNDAFFECHPIINFIYFILILVPSVLMLHPFVLGASFLGAFSYGMILYGKKSTMFLRILMTIPLMLVISLINPAFQHYGVTTLFYLKTGPVTLEALVYGIVLAVVLLISVLWFSCIHQVMTTDKLICLFGKVLPIFSLILSMTLRLIPKMKRQLKEIRKAQKGIGRDKESVSLGKKIRYGMKELSILITWSLEDAMETSDSMRSRGFGTGRRTQYSIYQLNARDLWMTIIGILLYCGFLVGIKNGLYESQYNPEIIIGKNQVKLDFIFYACWLIFCFLPVLLNVVVSIRKWRRLR